MKKKLQNKKIQKNNTVRSQNLPYRRMLFINKEIAGGNYPSSTTLAKKYGGVSSITIKRDIEYMRTMLDAPIEYNSSKKGYFYADKTFMMHLIFIDKNDLIAGYISEKLLTQYKTIPIYKRICDIFASFKTLIMQDKESLKFIDRVLFIEDPAPEFSEDTWNKIIKAVSENKYIDFSYKCGWGGVNINHVKNGYHIAPYQIICKAGVWYFAGYSKRQGTVCLYALHRIVSIELSSECFLMPEGYNYLNTNEKNLGIFSYDKKVKCQVIFSGSSANYVKEIKLFDDQKIKKIDNNSVLLTFSSGQIYDVLRFILSQGKNAVPVKPKELVLEWEENVSKMSENIKYKK